MLGLGKLWTRIHSLLVACRPANIARLVVAVVVDSIQRQAHRRTRADVCIERFETLAPALADLNAAAAIVFVFLHFGVVATLEHVPPDGVLGAQRHAVRAVVTEADAPTRLRESLTQATDEHGAFSAADASAQQEPSVVIALRFFSDDRPVVNRRPGSYRADQSRNIHRPILAFSQE